MKPYVRVFAGCVVVMVLALTQWLPPDLGVPLGTAGFVVIVLCVGTAILQFSSARNKRALGFFIVGLFLLLVAYPVSRPVLTMFEPAMRGFYAPAPLEAVFGVLSVVCIVRAWLLWTADKSA
jgi:hypothetical protein